MSAKTVLDYNKRMKFFLWDILIDNICLIGTEILIVCKLFFLPVGIFEFLNFLWRCPIEENNRPITS